MPGCGNRYGCVTDIVLPLPACSGRLVNPVQTQTVCGLAFEAWLVVLAHPSCVIAAAVVITCSGLCEEGVERLRSVTAACPCAGPQRVSGWLRHVLRLHADQLLPRLCSQTTPVISLAAKSTIVRFSSFRFRSILIDLYVYVVVYNHIYIMLTGFRWK